MAQINCTVGDLEGNSARIIEYIGRAEALGADIISFPELAVTGYPPEDLLLKAKFIDDNIEWLKKIAKTTGDITAIIGFVDRRGKDIYNAAAVIHKGKVRGSCQKIFLPNYGVFDEKRYFTPGSNPCVFRLGQVIFGVNICEDIWHMDGPTEDQAFSGARLIININASPYYAGKINVREKIVRDEARSNNVVISYTNLVGGQDELVFDGQSMLVNSSGKVINRARAFAEELLVSDVQIPAGSSKHSKKSVVLVSDEVTEKDKPQLKKTAVQIQDETAEVYQALLLGLKDYVAKNGFTKVVIGLSGGIDSALVAALAVDALGKDNVTGIFMPTHYTSGQSETDAKALADNLGIRLIDLSIDQIFKLYLMTLEPKFSGTAKDTTEENLQARIRGNALMAFSNKFGWLVLTTGNKSEMSTGYATLYGDMAGGFAVIKDVPKTLVYKLARYRNSTGAVIPEPILTREPTAELKAGQKDRDTLPPYGMLDKILKAYIEEDKGLNEIVKAGFERPTVLKVLKMVDRSEYKRRQSPPGIKITPKAFGRDRRMPITNKYNVV